MEAGADQDFPLPRLAPGIALARAPDAGGEPQWTLHHPAANTYFKIDWIAFECLSRFSHCRTASDLLRTLSEETTLRLTALHIREIVKFLQMNALLSLEHQAPSPRAVKALPWWKKILHGYLYFTIPLFRPQSFLEKTYPAISWMFSLLFIRTMLGFLLLMIVYTLPRIDEFLHSFANLLSPEGIVSGFIVFAFVKVIHEWAHAYAAVRNGVKVPHMGVAFMVLYPVLYTETTGSWQLSSRRARFNIAVAGITAELCLAGLFLAFWHISPPGSMMQAAAFLVVAVSLVGSLLINLNPLMRFDGYYMLSDATGIDNLQSRSCAFARWRLREILFGLGDNPPENLPAHRARFLTIFGAAIIIYRFFLFLGIALLVYHLFFQPLGLFLMMVEIGWFILLPAWSELKIWWSRRSDIIHKPRSFIPACVVGAVALLIIIPWKSTLVLPAMVHAGDHTVFYPPTAAVIEKISVRDGSVVAKDAVLAVLSAPDLDYKIQSAEQEVSTLETLRRRARSNPELMKEESLSDAALEKAKVKLASLRDAQKRLIIRAPFTGIVVDMNTDLLPGRIIGVVEPLFTLIDPSNVRVSAYATEDIQSSITVGSRATFIPLWQFSGGHPARVTMLAETGEDALPWPELLSLHGGPIAADAGLEGEPATRRSQYEIRADLEAGADQGLPVRAQPGRLYVETERRSLLSRWINTLLSIVRQEAKLG